MVGVEGTKIFVNLDYWWRYFWERNYIKNYFYLLKVLRVLALLLKNVEEILFGRIFLDAHKTHRRYMCIPRVKKSYLEKLFINYFTTCALPLVFIHLCNSIIYRTYVFPKVQLNLTSPSPTALIFSMNDTGVGTIPKLPSSLNLPLAFKNEDA